MMLDPKKISSNIQNTCDGASLIYTILSLMCYMILGINVEKYYIHNIFTTNLK